MSGKKFTSLSYQKLQNLDLKSVWTDIKEAIAGTDRDFTELPLAYVLAIIFDMGVGGACIAIITGETLLTIMGLYVFRKGKWKLRKV